MQLNLVPDYNEDKIEKTSTNNIKEENLTNNRKGMFLCKVTPYKDYFGIELNNFNKCKEYDIDDIPWIISRYVFDGQGEHGYRIHEGDLLKMGKFILKVRQIRLKSEVMQKTMIENKDKDEDLSRNIIKLDKELFNSGSIKKDVLLLSKNETNNHNTIGKDNNEDKPTCRICLGDEHDEVNPLINPCKCSGTMKYLHLSCLRQLIDSKIQKTVRDMVTVITFKTLECDICKSLLPENIRVKNKIYTIIDLNRPATNYMIIEGILKETPDTKSVFVIHFKESKPIKIGRASDADVRLSDISVSRSHALISINDGYCVLTDTKSKFGTLVNAGNKLCVLPGKPLSIQKGNILLRFNLNLKLFRLLSCYKPNKLPYKNYNMFFEATGGSKCQIKDVPNFLWTDTQIVSEYEDNNSISIAKQDDNNMANSTVLKQNNNDSRNVTGDITEMNAHTNNNQELL